jgi:hypothetical protein
MKARVRKPLGPERLFGARLMVPSVFVDEFFLELDFLRFFAHGHTRVI